MQDGKLPQLKSELRGKKETEGLVVKTRQKLIWLGIEDEAEVDIAEPEKMTVLLILMIAPNFLP